MRRAAGAFVGVLGVAAAPHVAVSVPTVCVARARAPLLRRSCALTPPSLRSCLAPSDFTAGFATSHAGAAVVVVSMSTQMETAWNAARVLECREECEAHRYLAVDVGVTGAVGSLCDSFRVPGMFVKLRVGGEGDGSFFAISCAPNVQGVFEFLIKDAPGTEWVRALRAGDSVEVSPVMGKGFPTAARLDLLPYPALPEEQLPRDVLLFATGSGIAPIRSAIESRLNGINPAQRRSVKLYYGARYPERMAYMDRFKLWESDGIDVIPVMSQPENSKELWTGRTGYVQAALKKDGITSPAQTGALLCGVKGMTEDVKKMLLEAGVKEDRILFNF